MLDVAAASKLFTRLVGVDRVTTEPDAVTAVLRCCAGLPLAIRIAAARVAGRPGRTIRTLADRLADATARLDQLQADDLGVRATFTIGYTRLPKAPTPPKRSAASAYGRAGSRRTGGERVDGPPARRGRRGLEALVEAHLLQNPGPERYRLHDLLAVFARERATSKTRPPSGRPRSVAS